MSKRERGSTASHVAESEHARPVSPASDETGTYRRSGEKQRSPVAWRGRAPTLGAALPPRPATVGSREDVEARGPRCRLLLRRPLPSPLLGQPTTHVLSRSWTEQGADGPPRKLTPGVTRLGRVAASTDAHPAGIDRTHRADYRHIAPPITGISGACTGSITCIFRELPGPPTRPACARSAVGQPLRTYR